ncbi:hypothetical protein QDX21_04780 [Auritidibacter ignavus]|uniref:Uncharacterized protein n=1 Tax=Auritidibacter ignavus TaxID=678932 RepID=A0AAJ6DFA7_9MICC|nr:hypothetical protein [Auritidibacter ignavus]WGH94108.1 hypothetical protein QDX21_04780 [Auritidibacter ignavus]
MVLDAWFWVATAICLGSLAICVVMTIIRTFPDDLSILSVGAVEIFLVIYGIYAAITPVEIQGPLWEFWGYLVVALILPVVAFFWAITDKSRWSNLVLGAMGPTVLVMIHRMQVIWHAWYGD